jgi:hypothetical protein
MVFPLSLFLAMRRESTGELRGSAHKVSANGGLARRRGAHQVKGGTQEEPVKENGRGYSEHGGDY